MAKANIANLVTGTKAFFLANLPAQLRLIETEKADGVALPDPKIHLIGFSDLFTGTDYPLVCYVADTMAFDMEQMAEWRNPEIDILVSLVHSRPETLETILLRYSDAWVNCLAADRSLGGICDFSYFTEMDWGHPGGDDKTHAVLAMKLHIDKEYHP